MLTTPLLLLLSAVPILGEEGESCRDDADCASPLACVAKMCTLRAPSPLPQVSSPPERTEPAQVVTDATPVDEKPPHFTGVHFVLGAKAGAGPLWTASWVTVFDQAQDFGATTIHLPMELRVGALFGRFELMAELAPATLAFFAGPVRQSSAALSAGFMVPLYERNDFSVSLPLRVRGGGFISATTGGGLVGGSAGIGLRFGGALVELRATAEHRRTWSSASFSVPVDLSFSWIF